MSLWVAIVLVLIILWLLYALDVHPLLALAAIVAVVGNTGCATTPAVVPARTAIPVECREPIPERPAMPTEQLAPDATVDQFVAAAEAEIQRREGYEDQLRTALQACRKPLKP